MPMKCENCKDCEQTGNCPIKSSFGRVMEMVEAMGAELFTATIAKIREKPLSFARLAEQDGQDWDNYEIGFLDGMASAHMIEKMKSHFMQSIITGMASEN